MKVGAPLAVLIILGVLLLLILGLLTLLNPVGAILGGLLASVAIGLVVMSYLWLDRWEPEPPRLLLFAFLWGAALSVLFAAVINDGMGLLISPVLVPVLVAPISEEIAKGAFLLLMLTGRRRKEMTSLTDHLVFAGLTAAGFAWTEDILYLVQNPDSFGVVAVMRLVFSPFTHPLFTSMTALGIYYGRRQKSGGMRTLLIIAGFLAAMLLHAIWNAVPTFFGMTGMLVAYFLFMVPVFALMIVVAVMSRRREQKLVATFLPGLVRDRVITGNQASWLATMAHRKALRTQVVSLAGPAGKAAVNQLADAVTELAFVRDRFDRGLADQRLGQLHAELVETVRLTRGSVPALDQIPPPPVPVPVGGPGTPHLR